MSFYREHYFELYNAITDAIELLKKAQLDCESDFMDWAEKPPILLNKNGETEPFE